MNLFILAGTGTRRGWAWKCMGYGVSGLCINNNVFKGQIL